MEKQDKLAKKYKRIIRKKSFPRIIETRQNSVRYYILDSRQRIAGRSQGGRSFYKTYDEASKEAKNIENGQFFLGKVDVRADVKALSILAEAKEQFDKLDMTIERLELTGQGSWRARFENGATIEMGHGSAGDIESRTQRFMATLSQVSSRYGRDLESADLRYSNGYALKLKGVTTLNPGDKDDKKVKR